MAKRMVKEILTAHGRHNNVEFPLWTPLLIPFGISTHKQEKTKLGNKMELLEAPLC